MPIEDLDGDIKETWLKTQSILSEGVSLEYERREKPTPKGKLYQVSNNLPGISSGKILHVRPSAVLSSYYKNSNAMRLPVKSNWKNKPKETDWVAGTKPGKMPQNELTDYYMTKQMWWLNPKYMYKQISEFLVSVYFSIFKYYKIKVRLSRLMLSLTLYITQKHL